MFQLKRNDCDMDNQLCRGVKNLGKSLGKYLLEYAVAPENPKYFRIAVLSD